MKTAGMLMWIIGAAVFAYAALGFDPSVEVEGFGTRVSNLSLFQQQNFLGLAGIALFLAGIIFHAAGEIIESLKTEPPRAAIPGGYTAPEIATVGGETDADLMARYGITREGDKYAFGQYKYDRLADAVAYAKKTS